MNTTENKVPQPSKPTTDMIAAAEAVFVAIAFEQTIRSIVAGYKRKILAENEWHMSRDTRASMHRTGDKPIDTRITDIRYAWLMSEADFAEYTRLCNVARITANLVVESEAHCPLGVAEEMTRQAKRTLCDVMADVSGIDVEMLRSMKMEHYEHFVDLTLRLLAPFVASAAEESNAVLCEHFGVDCRLVGDVYETDQRAKPISDEDRNKWMVTVMADQLPATLIEAIPLACSRAESQELAVKYLMLRYRWAAVGDESRPAGVARKNSGPIPTPVYLAFIKDQRFWPWTDDAKVYAQHVVIEVDGKRYQQEELEPATFDGTSYVSIIEGDVFDDMDRLHSLRDHFESWISGHAPAPVNSQGNP